MVWNWFGFVLPSLYVCHFCSGKCYVCDFRVMNIMWTYLVLLLGHLNNLRVLYSLHKTPASTAKKTARHIPSAPDRILDAPDLMDDFCE